MFWAPTENYFLLFEHPLDFPWRGSSGNKLFQVLLSSSVGVFKTFTSYVIWDGQLSFPSTLKIAFLLRSQLSVLFLLLYWSNISFSNWLLLGFSRSWVFSILLWCAFVQYFLCSYYLVPVASRICGLISFTRFKCAIIFHQVQVFFVISSTVFNLFPFSFPPEPQISVLVQFIPCPKYLFYALICISWL